MTTTDLANGVVIKSQLDAITNVQTQNALTGAKLVMTVINADGTTLASSADLIKALGATEYNSECAAALTSLNSALATAASAATTALTAL